MGTPLEGIILVLDLEDKWGSAKGRMEDKHSRQRQPKSESFLQDKAPRVAGARRVGPRLGNSQCSPWSH